MDEEENSSCKSLTFKAFTIILFMFLTTKIVYGEVLRIFSGKI